MALRFRIFAVGWALATLFHLAGNSRPEWITPTGTFLATQIGLAAAATAILWGWRRREALVTLCALIALSAWLEAPVVGNHWVLAAAISLAFLIGAGSAAWARVGGDEWCRQCWAVFAPAATMTLIVAYGFAAFAKLNADFFNPTVSCAVFYHDQLVRSWGLGVLTSAGRPQFGIIVALAAAATELAVAGLLIARRTRRLALAIALPFHWLLALDWSQHFWDFSAVLFVGFLLVADDKVLRALQKRFGNLAGAVRPRVKRMLAALGVLVLVVVAVAAVMPANRSLQGFAVLGGHVVWALVGTGAMWLVLMSLRGARSAPRWPGQSRHGVVLLVPILAFVNGLTPYLEIKTGFGWNMYSNLRTVAGETNHFFVPATFDLSRQQRRRVAIVETTDEALAPIAGAQYELVYSEFREYAHQHREESVTYRVDGRTVTAPRLGDDAAGRGGVSTLSHKLQSFRVVDTSGAQRCQLAFTPAR